MTENEQIQEMARGMCDRCRPKTHCRHDNICDAVQEEAEELYNTGYRKASEVAREIFEEIGKRFESLLGLYPCNGELEDAKSFLDFHWKYIKKSIMSDYKEGTTNDGE